MRRVVVEIEGMRRACREWGGQILYDVGGGGHETSMLAAAEVVLCILEVVKGMRRVVEVAEGLRHATYGDARGNARCGRYATREGPALRVVGGDALYVGGSGGLARCDGEGR